MPEDIIIEIIGGIVGFAVEFAALFWSEIILWTGELFAFWANMDMIPMAIETVELALLATASMTEEMLGAVMQAWNVLKGFLLDAIIEIVKSPEDSLKWIKRIVTIVMGVPKATETIQPQPININATGRSINIDTTGRPPIIKRTSEEEIDWDSLPADMRTAFIQGNQENYSVDFIHTREKELMAMRMTQ